MNLSSELPQLHLPNSCIMNSLLLDEVSMNSFSSQRAGSATVTGKKNPSLNCLSPSTQEKHKKFPIPIQTIKRIKNQNNQVKKILFNKNKPNQPLSPKSKNKTLKFEEIFENIKEEAMPRISSFPKYSIREESPSFLFLEALYQKPVIKPKNFLKKNLKNSSKDLENNLKKESKLQIEKNPKNKTKTLNSEIKTPRNLKTDTKKLKTAKSTKKLKQKEEKPEETKTLASATKLDFTKIVKTETDRKRTNKTLSIEDVSSHFHIQKRNSDAGIKIQPKKKKKMTKKNIFHDLKKKEESLKKNSGKCEFLGKKFSTKKISKKSDFPPLGEIIKKNLKKFNKKIFEKEEK